jgi:putative membrane protein
MKLRTGFVLVGAVLASMTAVQAPAQTATIHSRYSLSTASSANMDRILPKSGLSQADRTFLATMAQVNMAEIQIGQLAQRQGGDWGKVFGKDMEREHTMALEELKKIAIDEGFALPKDIDTGSKKGFNMLSQLNGGAFDGAYQQMMIKGHEAVLGKVRDEIRNGHDASARGYAVTLEPEVKVHLNLALKGTTMMSPGG